MTTLPEFDRPPVVETVLSVQFAPIQGMRSVHFGLYWGIVRTNYPKVEERPALPPIIEQVGVPSPHVFQPRFEVRDSLQPERVWLLNSAGTELIQLQTDRFIKNWRKGQPEHLYPRYEKSIKPGFLRDFESFNQFLADESLGPVIANQCEVTYVNHIIAGEGWNGFEEIENIFTFFISPDMTLEDGRFILRFPISSEDKQVGRLNVEVQPALRESDGMPMYVMSLTARGMLGSGIDFLDLGRKAIVSTFVKLTKPAMHNVWGRTQ